jgi:hypothetical protein
MKTSPESDRPSASLGSCDADLPLGCQLATPRRGFTHHGIYLGHGRVVHYAGLSRGWRRGPVEVVPLATFARGHGVRIVRTACSRFSAEQVVTRAQTRLGENAYRIVSNNCEHFCTWCLDGESRSAQVERLAAWPRAVARALRAAVAKAHGLAAGASAPSNGRSWPTPVAACSAFVGTGYVH